MRIGELKKSGGFVLILLGLTVAGVPFGLEEIGEATGLFSFPVSSTIKGWFAPRAPVAARSVAAKPVDWERYRRALEEFTEWADGRCVAAISKPKYDPVVIELPDERKTQRQIWTVPVTSCTARDPTSGDRGYVFVSGLDHPFKEGDCIAPTKGRCGYELVSVGERCVWLRAVFESEGDTPMGVVRFPEFTRVEDASLVRGNRKYVSRDAFPLVSGGWLMIDAFLPPDGAIFKIIDENYREVASLLCIVIGKRGGR